MGKDRNEKRFFDHLSVIIGKRDENKHGEEPPAEPSFDLWRREHGNGAIR